MQMSQDERCDLNMTEILLSHTQGNNANDNETVGGETGWRLERRLDNYNEIVFV
jgi:hypothetical protein